MRSGGSGREFTRRNRTFGEYPQEQGIAVALFGVHRTESEEFGTIKGTAIRDNDRTDALEDIGG